MNIKKTLATSAYPKMVLSFAQENFNLKILAAACLGILFLSQVVLVFLLKRAPQVIALDSTGAITTVETKVTDLQIQQAVKEYLSHRYSWSDKNIEVELKKAEFFVDSSLVSSFRKSMLETIKYVHDKKVTQRLYPRSVDVDLKNKIVTVSADRITEFDGLKAATESKVKLSFQIDDRTVINPWGVYVTKEQETVGHQ